MERITGNDAELAARLQDVIDGLENKDINLPNRERRPRPGEPEDCVQNADILAVRRPGSMQVPLDMFDDEEADVTSEAGERGENGGLLSSLPPHSGESLTDDDGVP